MGEEVTTIVFSGAVDPKFIDADGTVDSSRVFDARIRYTGKGAVTDANKRSFLTKLLDFINLF